MFLFDAATDRWFGLVVFGGLTVIGVAVWLVAAYCDRKGRHEYERALDTYGDAVVRGLTRDQLALTEWRLKQDIGERYRERFALMCDLMRRLGMSLGETRKSPEEKARKLIERSG